MINPTANRSKKDRKNTQARRRLFLETVTEDRSNRPRGAGQGKGKKKSGSAPRSLSGQGLEGLHADNPKDEAS